MDKKPKATKRRTWKKYDETTYSIEIVEWSIPYSFQLTRDPKDISWPFWEFKSLDVKGKFLQPEKLAGRDVDARIMGDRRISRVLENPNEPVQEPKAIGGLTLRGKQSEFLGSVPYDALLLLSVLLHSGKIKVIEITGDALYRGSADIRRISFEKEYRPNEDDPA